MCQRRHACRSTVRLTTRRATRAAVRTRWRVPDDLGLALASYGRAIRAHRRLARLAPRFFDSVVIERERREHEARRRWMASWEPALARAYGCEPKPPDPAPDLPPLPPPRTQRAVDRELASWAFWLNAGQVARERFQLRRPHALLSLSRLARLCELGFELGRLACGLDSRLPQSDPDNHDSALADLNRAYGHLANPTLSPPGSPPAPAAPESNLPRHSDPALSSDHLPPPNPEPRSPPAMSTPSPAELPRGHRRDAWSSWARHLRRLKT